MNRLELIICDRVKNNPELKRHIVRLYQRVCSPLPMNRLELFVYNQVRNNPRLKRRIVHLYQWLCGLVPQKSIVGGDNLVVRPGYFVGFHDKIPFSGDNSLLLAHRNLIGNRSVRPGDQTEIGVFSGAGWKSWSSLGRTSAWDWQLGCMLQWRGKAAREIVFNDIVDGVIGSRVITSSGQPVASYRIPVVHVSPDGELASSYCFRRLNRGMPGYGVRIAGDEDAPLHDFRCADPDGFRVFSLEDGKVRFEITLEQIRRIEPEDSMEGAFHYFHHSLFNPSGTRLFFFHRWVDRTHMRWTRMFACNPDGSRLFRFPTHEVVSHVGWIDERRLIAYARTAEQGDGYYIFRDGEPRWERVAGQWFNSDGHPMWSPSGDGFVTDSYPDRFRNQGLYLVDLERNRASRIVRTHLSRAFLDDLQVDLHPRFDRRGRTVCFDSGHLGERALCTVDVRSRVAA